MSKKITSSSQYLLCKSIFSRVPQRVESNIQSFDLATMQHTQSLAKESLLVDRPHMHCWVGVPKVLYSLTLALSQAFFCALLRLTTAKRLSQKPEFWAHRPEFFWRNPEFFRRIDLSFFSLRPKFFGE